MICGNWCSILPNIQGRRFGAEWFVNPLPIRDYDHRILLHITINFWKPPAPPHLLFALKFLSLLYFPYEKCCCHSQHCTPLTELLISQVFLVSAWNKICWAASFPAQLGKWAVTSMTVITQPFIFLCACGICHQFFSVHFSSWLKLTSVLIKYFGRGHIYPLVLFRLNFVSFFYENFQNFFRGKNWH